MRFGVKLLGGKVSEDGRQNALFSSLREPRAGPRLLVGPWLEK